VGLIKTNTVGKPEGKKILIGGRTIFEWILKMGWHGFDSCGSGYGPVAESCEHGNKHSGSIKCLEILE
jgi:hypothetical protein